MYKGQHKVNIIDLHFRNFKLFTIQRYMYMYTFKRMHAETCIEYIQYI